jgi:hypothetical protein
MKLTPHERARFEIWLAVEGARYDGYYNAHDYTPEEMELIEAQVDKHKNDLYKRLGIERLYDKLKK